MKKAICISLTVFLFTSPIVFAQLTIEEILDSPSRTAQDRKSDLNRRPSEFIRFLDIKPGMTVLDVFSGAGYYTEIVANAVGPTGKVDAHNNQAYVNYVGADKIGQRYNNNRLPNVTQLIQEANHLTLQNDRYDRILLVLSFHDLFYVDTKNGWPEIEPTKFMLALGSALKEGGVIGIIDHVAAEKSDISSAQTMHRISTTIIKQKMQKWGFTLASEANYLRNPKDPLDIPMWDQSIRGKTDRAVMKFTYAK